MEHRRSALFETTVSHPLTHHLNILLTLYACRQGTPAYTLFATSPPGSKQRGRPNEPDFVGILITMVRLEQQKTDIIIAINVPHIAGQYNPTDVDPEKGRQGALLEQAIQYRQKVMETFEIRDWELFVQE